MPTSYDTYLKAARCYIIESEGWTAAAVAQIAFDNQCGVWHAAHLLMLERIADGRMPMDTCSLCGGPNTAERGDHSLCTARQAHGRPIERLDSTPQCECWNCRQERKAVAR